ncbi:hypothetical protein A343_1122 [Porphyromonas gingivalis JCVI SC001]|nr:hypothetical protein A343_1122 [Porphyromonas gingivalis JCVI SC001]
MKSGRAHRFDFLLFTIEKVKKMTYNELQLEFGAVYRRGTFPRDNILSGAKARARSGVPIGTQGNSFRRGS